MSKKNLTIIDADSIAYMCGNAETLEESIEKVDSRIENIIKNTNADYISLFISKGKYFRHDVFDGYKANRTGKPPKWMRTIKTYLEDKYKANWMPKAEADDLVAYWMNKDLTVYSDPSGVYFEPLEYMKSAEEVSGEKLDYDNLIITMAAIDKDLLKSIEGKHYNYTFKPTDAAKAKKKADPEYKIMESEIVQGWLEETDKIYADNFIWLQMLMGDGVDGVVGIPKMGPKKAEKYMQDMPSGYWPYEWGLRRYTEHFGIALGIYEFQKNYRLLYMLKNDEDFMREIGKTPEFPTIIDVKSLLPEPETKKVEF